MLGLATLSRRLHVGLFLNNNRRPFLDIRTKRVENMHSCSRTQSSTWIVRDPSPSAPREVPTPLIFLSSSALDPASRDGMSMFASMFAEQGYTCVDSDMALPDGGLSNSADLMNYLEKELQNSIRLSAIPFAPVIIARSTATLIAQTYVSSNPATGLFLISPPPSNESIVNAPLSIPIPEFNFEPLFPIAIMSLPHEMVALKEKSRLCRYDSVDKIIVQETASREAFQKLAQWLDDIGV